MTGSPTVTITMTPSQLAEILFQHGKVCAQSMSPLELSDADEERLRTITRRRVVSAMLPNMPADAMA